MLALASRRTVLLGSSLIAAASAGLAGNTPFHYWDFVNDRTIFGTVDVGGVVNTPGWSFARASAGYADTSAGALIPFASGQLRRTDRGALIELARTNLILRSQEFDNASWTKTDVTVTANATTAPDGALTADLLTEGSAGTATVVQGVTATADVAYSMSRYVKLGNTPWVKLWIGSGANQLHAWFNLQTGAVGTASASGTATMTRTRIEAKTNGWYRCIVTGSIGSGATAIDFHSFSAAADNSDTRVNGATRYEWGAQFEVASSVSSYIATTTATVTRAADVLNIGSISGLAYPLSFFCEYFQQSTPSSTGVVMQLDGGSADDRTQLVVSSLPAYQLYVATGGVDQALLTPGTPNYAVIERMAARVATDSVQLGYVGSLGTEDTTATVPGTPTTLRIGTQHSSAFQLQGYVRRLAIFKGALTDASLRAMTA